MDRNIFDRVYDIKSEVAQTVVMLKPVHCTLAHKS